MSAASILNLQPSTTFAVGTSRLPVVSAYLTWGDPVNDPPSALGSMSFDAVLSEEHDRGAIVTDHPVEQGTNIVDNVRPLPDRITLDVFVSNSPINSPDADRQPLTLDLPQPGQGSFLAGGTSAIIGSAAQALLSVIGFGKPPNNTALVDQFYGDTDYVQNAFDQLTTLQSTATLLSVITPHVTYTNMVIENVKMHRGPSTGTSANITIELREVVIVYSAVVAAPLPSIPRGAPTASTGAQATKPASEQKASLAKDRANASGLLRAGSGV